MRIPRPTRSQLGVGTLVVASLAVGQLLNRNLPELDPNRSFVTTVSDDGIHHLRFGDIEVREVIGSRSVKGSLSTDDVLGTPGVFVVVVFTWTPLVGVADHVPGISYGELTDAQGRVTRVQLAGSRSRLDCTGGTLTIPSTCAAVVEADPETLAGSTLQLGRDFLDPRFDSVAEVDLQISADDVRKWLRAPMITVPATGPKEVRS